MDIVGGRCAQEAEITFDYVELTDRREPPRRVSSGHPQAPALLVGALRREVRWPARPPS
jgi:hypothetical protein